MPLRARLLIAHCLVVGAALTTLLLVALLLAPTIHDRLMTEMGVPLHDDLGEMTAMASATEHAFRAAMIQGLLIAAPVAAAVALLAGLITSRQIVAPIAGLLGASQRIAAGHYDERVPERGDAELLTLAAQFNTMAQELEQTERRRRELIADVAHELRTPLATIQGYAEGLLDGVVAADAATWALLRDEAARLARLTDALRDLSLAESHQLALHIQPTPAHELLDRAMAVIAPQYAERGVALSADAASAPGAVRVDADKMAQVLINLLGNALRATPGGGAVRVVATQRDGRTTIIVRDNGGGIAPEDLPHLFERFYRADPSRSRRTGGSGVGLTIARAIVEAHGGTLTLSSDGIGLGATATIVLAASSERP